jgi:hypothetical protein
VPVSLLSSKLSARLSALSAAVLLPVQLSRMMPAAVEARAGFV